MDDLDANREQMKRLLKVFFGIEGVEGGSEVVVEFEEKKEEVKEEKTIYDDG